MRNAVTLKRAGLSLAFGNHYFNAVMSWAMVDKGATRHAYA
jgi:hypothetical protein